MWTASLATAVHLDPGRFTLPMVLLVAGSGSFLEPYYLDTNDLYLRSIPSRAKVLGGESWIDLVATLNNELRIASEKELELKKIQDLLKNAEGILEGIFLRIGFYSNGEFTLNRPVVPRKLAIELHGSVITTPCGESTDEETNSARRDSNSTNPASEDRNTMTSSASTHLAVSSIRHAALFLSDDESDQPLRRDVSVTRNVPPQSPRAHPAQPKWYDWWMNLKNLQVIVDESIHLRPTSTLAMVVMDIVLAFLLMMEIRCIQIQDPTSRETGCSHVAFYLVLMCFPLAIAVSPFYVFVYIWHRNPLLGRHVCVWHCCSMLNFAVAWSCSLLYWKYLSPFALILSSVGLVIKFLEKRILLRCVVQFEQERRVVGWRGLATTQDYYDAATTPLI